MAEQRGFIAEDSAYAYGFGAVPVNESHTRFRLWAPDARQVRLELEGQPGRAYALGVTRPERVRGVVGAELREGRLHFTIPGAPDETFVPHVITFAVIPREEKP